MEKQDIERVQKVALHIILGDQYESYSNALRLTNLVTLEARRDKLCIKFAKKAEKHEKHKMWFKTKPDVYTRQSDDKYWRTVARTNRLKQSPISHLTNLLNEC